MSHLAKAEASIMAIVEEQVAKATSELRASLEQVTAERDAAILQRDDALRHWEEWLTDTIDRATGLRAAVQEKQ